MKFVSRLILLLLVAAAGYFLYPQTRDLALGQFSGAVVEKREVQLSDGSSVIVSLSSLTQEDFPETITLTDTVTLKADDASTLELAGGEKVRPVGKLGNKVKVEHLSLPYANLVPIRSTDFESKALDEIEARLSSMQPTAATALVEKQDAADEAEAERIAEEQAAKEEEEEMAKAEPEEEVEEEGEPVTLSDEQIVEAMEKSLAQNKLKSIKADQVSLMEATDEEEIDGVMYQTGLATYEGETLFGVMTRTAKALIRNGKVVRWISPKSGLEID